MCIKKCAYLVGFFFHISIALMGDELSTFDLIYLFTRILSLAVKRTNEPNIRIVSYVYLSVSVLSIKIDLQCTE